MKALTAEQQTQHDALAAALADARDALDAALRTFDERARALWDEEVAPRIEAMNAEIEKAETFRDEIAATMDDYSGEKSDRWLESDSGERFQEWRTAWDASFDLVELDADDALDTVEFDSEIVDSFLNLPLTKDDA